MYGFRLSDIKSLEMENDITFRKATLTDYHQVVAIGEIYGGADYIPSQYETILNSDNQTGYVGVVNDEIVAFVVACILDNGETLVTRAGRVKDMHKGQGIYGLLVNFVRKQFAVLDSVKYEAFTTHTSNFDKNKDRIKATFTEILDKNVLYYRSRFTFNDLKVPPNSPTRLQKKDLQVIFSSEVTCKHLFPRNRMVVGWIPFRLLSSNIDHIMKKDTFMLASRRADMSNNDDVMYTCLTVGKHHSCKFGIVYFIDIFGSDVTEARDHIHLHADNLQRIIAGRDCELMVMHENELLHGDIEDIINSISVSKPIRYEAGKLFLFEKSFK